MASQVQQAVASFVEVLFNEPDETLTQYLITVLADAEASCIDTAELQEVVAGFSAKFEQRPAHEQHDLLWSLVTQVRFHKYCFHQFCPIHFWTVALTVRLTVHRS